MCITREKGKTNEITETHTVSYDVTPDELRNSPDELQYQRLHTENTTQTTSKKERKKG